MALGQRESGADFELVAHTDRGSQYSAADYTQELDDHGVLASVGSVGDAYDNAMAESFVDTFKTELIADRVWRSRSQLELAVLEYISWFNNDVCMNPWVISHPQSSRTYTLLGEVN